ncbi:MAG: DbpA RNA binding domain-containing protein [Spirochaetes bacterium]|nr:DbpA RNA binding domain-containing protein [Spirochaetota bacterium]
MNHHQKRKLDRIIEISATEDLSEYGELLNAMKKGLGVPFFGTRRLAAAMLKEIIGDISQIEFSKNDFKPKQKSAPVFEDVNDGKVKMFLNIGKNHRIMPGDIIKEIVRRSGIDGKAIGKIDIHTSYTFIEIPEQYAEIVLLSFDNARMRGVNAVLEPAKKKKDIKCD